ncbi:hypothetical protein V6Z92_002412 [Aspergillus fumigatus]
MLQFQPRTLEWPGKTRRIIGECSDPFPQPAILLYSKRINIYLSAIVPMNGGKIEIKSHRAATGISQFGKTARNLRQLRNEAEGIRRPIRRRHLARMVAN